MLNSSALSEKWKAIYPLPEKMSSKIFNTHGRRRAQNPRRPCWFRDFRRHTGAAAQTFPELLTARGRLPWRFGAEAGNLQDLRGRRVKAGSDNTVAPGLALLSGR